MKYRVLDEIAYEAGRNEMGRPVFKAARKGDVVELTDKDAAALKQRGAVVETKE